MHKKAALAFLLAAHSLYATAQTTYIPLGDEEYNLLDRLETRSGRLTNDFFTTIKPVSRKGEVHFLEQQEARADSIGLTSLDRYNMRRAISISGEWAADGDGAIDSKLPWFKKTFYRKQPDFVNVNEKDFYLVVNPVISGQLIHESATGAGIYSGSRNLFSSSRGAEVRARIAGKIGLYLYAADNQEQPVSYVDEWIEGNSETGTNANNVPHNPGHQAVPGADYYQHSAGSKTYDYLQARGYIDFAAVKDHINVSFGYDKQFIGDGLTSLFLSDFSSGATFLRLNTKVWRLNYENLFMELVPQYTRGLDQELPHKYASVHHLSINATRWLNVGLFESVISARSDHYPYNYLVPVIFYRAIERSNGSPDNENLGFNFKAIILKHFQLYGQLFLDEFRAKELFSNSGWYGNKYGIQLGGKYYDAFTIKNLDLQGELNFVRPFTYSHYDSDNTYTNYNQPLAHPVGAGFGQFIGLARYQPLKRLYLSLKGIYYRQGIDTGGTNYGSNIFLSYNANTPVNPANPEYGYGLVNGVKTTTILADLGVTYELRPNLFIDLGVTKRRHSYDGGLFATENSNWVYGGFRLNIAKRDYNFY